MFSMDNGSEKLKNGIAASFNKNLGTLVWSTISGIKLKDHFLSCSKFIIPHFRMRNFQGTVLEGFLVFLITYSDLPRTFPDCNRTCDLQRNSCIYEREQADSCFWFYWMFTSSFHSLAISFIRKLNDVSLNDFKSNYLSRLVAAMIFFLTILV